MQFFTVCDLNSQVNNLKASKSETVSGWTFSGIKYGPWNQNAAKWGCTKASWFGWDWPGAASISTTLHGKGKAILEFGNCHKNGNVAVYKNDVKLSSVGAKKEDQIEFEFLDNLIIFDQRNYLAQFTIFEMTKRCYYEMLYYCSLGEYLT